MEKGNLNGLDSTNKYTQGSVWKWVRKEYTGNTAGVQSSERPVLIISNDTFNARSQSVNCVSITSVLKESPVHVPIYITMDSHIQCEQIHTVSKNELTEYKGTAPAAVLSNVKAKIRMQLGMHEDKSTELLNSIKRSIDELSAKKSAKPIPSENTAILNAIKDNLHDLNKKADKGFGVPDIENDVVRFLTNIHNYYIEIKADINAMKDVYGKNSTENTVKTAVSDIVAKAAGGDETDRSVKTGGRGRGKQRQYTDEDKRFIADKNNPIEVIAEKYGYTKQYAHKMRHYFKNKLNINDDGQESDITPNAGNDKETPAKHTKHMRYTEEDILFITDKKNSIAALIKKYGFEDKKAAYRVRNYLKRAYIKTKK